MASEVVGLCEDGGDWAGGGSSVSSLVVAAMGYGVACCPGSDGSVAWGYEYGGYEV